MPLFIAVHSVSFDEQTLVQYAKEEAPKFPERGATWIKTYCAPEDEKQFCVWEASDKGAIEQLFKDYEIPYDSVHKVKTFDVSTATLED
jgi:hypothetical protein